MRKLTLLMFGLFLLASPANAQVKTTVGLDITAVPLGDPFSTSIGLLNPAVNIQLTPILGIGARVGVAGAEVEALGVKLAEARSTSLDISVAAELSKVPNLSILAFGGPTLFFAKAEVLGAEATDNGVGFHVGGDVTYFVNDKFGINGTVVVNRGGDDAGFERYGGGIRFRF